MTWFGEDRSALRRVFVEAWTKRNAGMPLEPLEAMIAGVIEDHPEYHALLETPDLERDYLPGLERQNPFLHMAMHIAIREQVAADRPPGVRKLHAALVSVSGSAVGAEHRMLDCLEQALSEAQQAGAQPDERAYLACVERLARREK